MKIDRAGLPFILGALFPAAAFVALRRPGWALPLASLAGFFAFFFRDPERAIPNDTHDPHMVLSPADGLVVHAGAAESDAAPAGTWTQNQHLSLPARRPCEQDAGERTYSRGRPPSGPVSTGVSP